MKSGAAPQAVLVPAPAGDLFVSENAEVSGRLYRNAEINAASNVALRPLCDPAYQGAWSVAPIDVTTGRAFDSMKGEGSWRLYAERQADVEARGVQTLRKIHGLNRA
jgi:hypothetical protein